jgi:hypothetical protein
MAGNASTPSCVRKVKSISHVKISNPPILISHRTLDSNCQDLVTPGAYRWVHPEASDVLLSEPSALEALSPYQLQKFDTTLLAAYLQDVMPKESEHIISNTRAPSRPGGFDKWLERLWVYLTRASEAGSEGTDAQSGVELLEARLRPLDRFHLVPVEGSSLLRMELRQATMILSPTANMDDLDPDIKDTVFYLSVLGLPRLAAHYDRLCSGALGGMPPDPSEPEQNMLWASYLAERANYAQQAGLIRGGVRGTQEPEQKVAAEFVYDFFKRRVHQLMDDERVRQGVRSLPIYLDCRENAKRRPLPPNAELYDAAVAGVPEGTGVDRYVAYDPDAAEFYAYLGLQVPDPVTSFVTHVLPKLSQQSPQEVRKLCHAIVSLLS